MWNTNKCQVKALVSIQLRTCKYILGCSVTTCEEPVRVSLGLKTSRNRRDFCKLKRYCMVMCMNDEGLLKLLANKLDEVKCKGCPRKSLPAQVDFLRKELSLQDQVLGIKLFKKALDKRECKEFEMALKHKSKLQVDRKLKGEIGLEEYLHMELVKRVPSRLFLNFRLGTSGLFKKELGRHASRGGS